MTKELDTGDLTVTRLLPVVSELPAESTADQHAEAVGLVYVNGDEPGITRLRWGKGFTYRFPDGRTIPRDHPERQRAVQLAIPPAWDDVWVCRDPRGHIQATGTDDAGRKQYRYHPRWHQLRNATKFHRMEAFAAALPRIRRTVDDRLRKRRLTRGKILALVLALLDETLIRIGSDRYAATTGAHGLTTLDAEHVEIDGSTVTFEFPGKGGQQRRVELRDRRLARQLLRCEEIPGQRLFSYDSGEGCQDVASEDVNEFLGQVCGDDLTAKDFRTWGATVVATTVLRELGPPRTVSDADSKIIEAVDAAADRLGNSRAVARASYIDPRVPKAYRFGKFDDAWDGDTGVVDGLAPAERAVKRILRLDMPPSADLTAPPD